MPPVQPTVCGGSELQSAVPMQKNEVYKRLMITNGWCPHRVNYLARRYKMETLGYLSSLVYLREQKHDRCRSAPSCVAYTVNNSTYKTRHVDRGCTCEFVETPFEDLKRIAETGSIPLIEIEKNDEISGYSLRVRERKLTSRYVAISHVWADGMGNPARCALPTCQIERLYKTVEKVFLLPRLGRKWRRNPVLIWMDTLCIPPSDIVIKMAQIDKMASIYKGACTCLIMDAELMSMAPKRKDDLELTLDIWARYICSAWNSRSWTLQEGTLPAHRTVLFADSTLAVLKDTLRLADDIEIQPATCDDILVQEPESDNERRIRNDLQVSWKHHDGNPRRFETIGFAEVWNELAGRTTSQPGDVPLIIANLLNLDVSDLLSCSLPEERYQAILLSISTIPLSLFSNNGPRYHGGTATTDKAWIPTAIIGSEMLLEKPCAHVSFEFGSGRETMTGLILDRKPWYLSQPLILPLPKYLKFANRSLKFCFEPPDLYLDEADIEGNVQICIFMDPKDLDVVTTGLRASTVRRGSCFKIIGKEGKSVIISFRGPLRLTSSREDLHDCFAVGGDDDDDDTLRIAKRADDCNWNFLITCDVLPGVQHLRWRVSAESIGSKWFTLAFMLVWLGSGSAGLNSFRHHLEHDPGWKIAVVCTALVIGWVLVGAGVCFLLARLELRLLRSVFAWQNTRAYERIRRTYEIPREV
ncbi:uncharacterized protein RHO25_004107 [Cercospora beticola]|uniref:Heterokaryon incompatibility domain-containing protein n=1 Tax=Cercospora beticola TaxID=122368 RepID=A0ABZ0NJ27_CERBT|nr:hypothetical protein RHO25_004107 [Cercospora beticola]